MRTSAALLALFLAGCADGVAPWAPPVVINHTFQREDEIVCTETLVRIGLPNGLLQVFGWAKRTWTCELHRKPATQVEGGFRK